jgi:nitrile hydratase
VIAVLADWPLPDAAVRGELRVETCYAVRFPAGELWGTGDHTVTVDLWESYLERA